MPVKYKIIFDDIQALFSLFLQSLKEQELTDAVKYVSRSPDIIESIRSSLRYQPSKVSVIFINYIRPCKVNLLFLVPARTYIKPPVSSFDINHSGAWSRR